MAGGVATQVEAINCRTPPGGPAAKAGDRRIGETAPPRARAASIANATIAPQSR
jgi:hypothetical protein